MAVAVTSVPVPSIPNPDGSSQSMQQAVMTIKQNVEVLQGTRPTGNPNATNKTQADIARAAALRRVSGL